MPERDFEAEIAQFIRPERLEVMLNRPIPKFDGKTARELIAEGRGEELVNTLKAALNYAVTA